MVLKMPTAKMSSLSDVLRMELIEEKSAVSDDEKGITERDLKFFRTSK